LEGCKYAGKSVAACHKIARHLWETDRAEVAMMARTIKSAKSAGIYVEMCSVIEQWMREGGYFGGVKKNGDCNWIKPGPQTTDGVSKVPHCIVRNMHGTESRLSLFNCQETADVEVAMKGTRFSMIYFGEITNFPDRVVFDACKPQLRCLHLPYEAHQFLCDCNPDERGEESWIYRLWFIERFLPPESPAQKLFRSELHSIHFEIADNTMVDPREFEDLKASYEYNQDLYDRYIRGLWTSSTVNSHFADVFIPNIHIVGSAVGPSKEDFEVVVPDDSCHELFTGWDMGAVNHAGAFAQKRIVNKQVQFDFIDELVFLKEKISIEDFALLMLEKKHYWEEYCLREYGTKEINWRHWSDDSAWNYRSAANAEDELIVRNVTDGEIMLLKAHKGAGSVELRINLVRKLLFQKRMFISAQLFETIRAIKGVKKGRNKTDLIDPVDPLKHIFDATSYILIGESPMDAQNHNRPKVEKRSSVVTVGL
jgi:predicted nucleotidyltransferase